MAKNGGTVAFYAKEKLLKPSLKELFDGTLAPGESLSQQEWRDLTLTEDGRDRLYKYCYCLLNLSRIPVHAKDKVHSMITYFGDQKNSLLETPISLICLVRLFTERVSKIYAFLDLWSLKPSGYKLVKEIVNEETGEVTGSLTAFQRKDLCVDDGPGSRPA